MWPYLSSPFGRYPSLSWKLQHLVSYSRSLIKTSPLFLTTIGERGRGLVFKPIWAKASSELSWLKIFRCPSSLASLSYRCIFYLHFHLLLQNHWTNFNQTWHKASLDKVYSSLFKWRATYDLSLVEIIKKYRKYIDEILKSPREIM